MKAKDQLILIVDLDAHFREGLYNFLLSAGYERVDSAENYRNALEKTRETEYDVVLLDAG
jgi:DNA-binding response OmpR family regulator